MRRAVVLLVVSLVVAACATTSQRGQDLVGRAVQAMGGAEALAGVKTISVKGTVRQWEPEQSIAAGGEMRHANDATFEVATDVGAQATRIDWVRNFVYPSPRTFTFTEIVTPEAGYVAGIDSNGRTKQSLDSNPPAHSMSGLRLAASQRELRRVSLMLFLEMLRNPDRVSAAGDVTAGGASYPAVAYRVGDQTFTVLFERETGLPVRVRTLDYDNMWGDVTYDMVLSDWRQFDGIRLATSRKYELNGRPVMELKVAEAKFNAPVAAERVAIPAAFKAAAPKPATGPVPYQWVIRRQFIGTYLDSDNPSFDTRATSGLRLVELAPGVQHVVGGSHHALLVEMRDHLVVFDAPVSDAHSNMVLGLARQKFGPKPVKYLVLSHHHMDHAGGFRAYAAQGATLVVGKGNGEHFRRLLAAPFTRDPDLPARDLKATPLVEVVDKWVATDGAREVQAYLVENPHAAGYLIGYVPEARLGFVVDVWSPGAAPLPDKLTPPLAALVAGVKKAGIEPQKFAGGHGSVGDYAPLAALEGK
jgi:glyoxylase-like metal-dependent hydrolase (beta-lactamase superfamily II)/predicted small secreted protein